MTRGRKKPPGPRLRPFLSPAPEWGPSQPAVTPEHLGCCPRPPCTPWVLAAPAGGRSGRAWAAHRENWLWGVFTSQQTPQRTGSKNINEREPTERELKAATANPQPSWASGPSQLPQGGRAGGRPGGGAEVPEPRLFFAETLAGRARGRGRGERRARRWASRHGHRGLVTGAWSRPRPAVPHLCAFGTAREERGSVPPPLSSPGVDQGPGTQAGLER